MKYKKDFHAFQTEYTEKYSAANTMRKVLLETEEIKGKKILDVGCGSGIDLAFLSEQGARVSGIDISPELVTLAQTQLPDSEILEGTLNSLPWEKEKFDIIWSKYAVQHEKDITLGMSEMYRVLKKDGKIFLQVTHPMRTVGLLESNNYFNSGELINYPIIDGGNIVEYHHTFAEWINVIIRSGFKITFCQEILNRPANEYQGVITPSAIIFVLEKK